jgi:hypothetical protein
MKMTGNARNAVAGRFSMTAKKTGGVCAAVILAVTAVSCIPPIGSQDPEFETDVYVSWLGIGSGARTSRGVTVSRGVIWVPGADDPFRPEEAYAYYDNHLSTMNAGFQTLFDRTGADIRLVPPGFNPVTYDLTGPAGAAYRAQVDTYRKQKYAAAAASVAEYWLQFDTGGEVREDIVRRNTVIPNSFAPILAKINVMQGKIGNSEAGSDAEIDAIYDYFVVTGQAIAFYYEGLASVWLGSLRGPVKIVPMN